MIDISDSIIDAFGLETDIGPYTVNFEAMGFESPFQLVNASFLNVSVFLGLVFVFALPLMMKCNCVTKRPKCLKAVKAARERTFFNGILAFLETCYLPVMIQALLNIKEFSDGRVNANISLVTSIVWLLVLPCFEIFKIVLFYRNFDSLGAKKIINRFGVFYCDKLYENKHTILLYSLAKKLRVVVLVFGAIWLRGNPVLQFITLTFFHFLVLNLLIYHRPYRARFVNWAEFRGEALILTAHTVLFALLDLNTGIGS